MLAYFLREKEQQQADDKNLTGRESIENGKGQRSLIHPSPNTTHCMSCRDRHNLLTKLGYKQNVSLISTETFTQFCFILLLVIFSLDLIWNNFECSIASFCQNLTSPVMCQARESKSNIGLDLEATRSVTCHQVHSYGTLVTTGLSRATRVNRYSEGRATNFVWASLERFIKEMTLSWNPHIYLSIWCFPRLGKFLDIFNDCNSTIGAVF